MGVTEAMFEAFVGLSVEEGTAVRDAAKAGEKAGKAFGQSAQGAAGKVTPQVAGGGGSGGGGGSSGGGGGGSGNGQNPFTLPSNPGGQPGTLRNIAVATATSAINDVASMAFNIGKAIKEAFISIEESKNDLSNAIGMTQQQIDALPFDQRLKAYDAIIKDLQEQLGKREDGTLDSQIKNAWDEQNAANGYEDPNSRKNMAKRAADLEKDRQIQIQMIAKRLQPFNEREAAITTDSALNSIAFDIQQFVRMNTMLGRK
jgi:hypothetical protein